MPGLSQISSSTWKYLWFPKQDRFFPSLIPHSFLCIFLLASSFALKLTRLIPWVFILIALLLLLPFLRSTALHIWIYFKSCSHPFLCPMYLPYPWPIFFAKYNFSLQRIHEENNCWYVILALCSYERTAFLLLIQVPQVPDCKCLKSRDSILLTFLCTTGHKTVSCIYWIRWLVLQ